MPDIDEIKREHFADLTKRRVILIVHHDYGFNVEQWLPNGVAPTSSYDTAQEAAARALQLLGLKDPITPQSWPETVGIGDNPGPPPRTPYPSNP